MFNLNVMFKDTIRKFTQIPSLKVLANASMKKSIEL